MVRQRRPAYECAIIPASHVNTLDVIMGAPESAWAEQRPLAAGSGSR
jgi:hypothetical protein